jgi:hypothetical protein
MLIKTFGIELVTINFNDFFRLFLFSRDHLKSVQPEDTLNPGWKNGGLQFFEEKEG